MNEHVMSKCRIGVDVGGTFTDLVLADTLTNELTYFKEPSTPHEPSEAVERGILGILNRAGRKPDNIELVVHGTTIGLNAIIQRRGARLALVVSEGNGDVFEIARGKLADAFDYRASKELSLIPRHLVFEVPMRTDVDGTETSTLGDAAFEALVARLKASDISAVAVTLLNSYRHPALEQGLAARLRAALPEILVSESAELWPEIREYERALVASLNSYIHPLMNRYFDTLQTRLRKVGMEAPIYVTANNGGTLGFSTARSRPIDTILSGPSAGVVASSRLASYTDTTRLITFDMGGTSSDIAVSMAGTPEFTTHTMIGDFPLILPVVNVSAIGAGGGSIIWTDAQGVLKVGPLSAGAAPGPICYRRGGEQPTVTDCYVSLGIMRPDGFLGGRMQLDRESAMKALADVAGRIGLAGAEHAAEAALQIATAKMATELLKVLAQRGLDPSEFTLVAYGGAGPTQANFLAEEIGVEAIMVPLSPGTLCALGAIATDLKRDYVRTIRKLISEDDDAAAAELATIVSDLEQQAKVWLVEEGDIVGPVRTLWSADLRYKGEGQETRVQIPAEVIEARDIGFIIQLFHAQHETLYGFRSDDVAVELAALRAQVIGTMPELTFPDLSPGMQSGGPIGTRSVFHKGKTVDAQVYRRPDLRSGDTLAGPALVEQEDTTVWIIPGWTGRVTDQGVIFITRTAE